MAMTHSDPIQAMIEAEEPQIVRHEVSAVSAITKSETEAQIDCAHKYPRSVARFLKDAASLATITQEVAESCIYALPRDGKTIAGPSVRLAEIAASCYGNLHYGARIVDEEERQIVAQGVCWDIEKNVRVTLEVKRRIVGRNGRRFSDDMVTVTGNAAASIALRNAVFRVIPRSYINAIYEQARRVAVGNAQTLANRRAAVLERLQKIGVPTDRVLAKLDKRGVEDIGLEDLEVLIGLGTAIKNGEANIDALFPPVVAAPTAPADDGKRVSLKGARSKPSDKAQAAPQSAVPTPVEQPATPPEASDAPPWENDERQPGEEG